MSKEHGDSDRRLGEHNPHDDKAYLGQHDGRSAKRSQRFRNIGPDGSLLC